MTDIKQKAREFVAMGLDEYGHHTEARNVRNGEDEDLDIYRCELWSVEAALQQREPEYDREVIAEGAVSALVEKWPARFACNGPEGSFWTDDNKLADMLISSAYDRDEWTVTDTNELEAALKGGKA